MMVPLNKSLGFSRLFFAGIFNFSVICHDVREKVNSAFVRALSVCVALTFSSPQWANGGAFQEISAVFFMVFCIFLPFTGLSEEKEIMHWRELVEFYLARSCSLFWPNCQWEIHGLSRHWPDIDLIYSTQVGVAMKNLPSFTRIIKPAASTTLLY